MWLSDFEEAIAAMKKHCTWACFSKISTNVYGDFIFEPHEITDFYFVYFRKTGMIVKRFLVLSTKHPEHEEIIYKGDK